MPRECVFPDRLTQVESPDGQVFSVYVDIDRLEEHMLDVFPEDAAEIRRYTRGARAFRKYDLLETSALSRAGLLRYLSAFPLVLRWATPTMADVGARLRNPFLRKAFPTVQYDWTDIPAMLHLNMLAQCSRRNYGFPVGGSLPFAQAIERRYSWSRTRGYFSDRRCKVARRCGRAAWKRSMSC